MKTVILFKKALASLLHKYPVGPMVPVGLCHGVMQEIIALPVELTNKERFEASYGVMSAILTHSEFMNRELGPIGCMTKERYNFGMFVLGLPDKNIADMIDSAEKE